MILKYVILTLVSLADTNNMWGKNNNNTGLVTKTFEI